jgi:hypothetical protein
MDGYQLAFLAMTLVGGAFLVFSLLVGEVADVFGGDADLSGGDGPSWASPTVLAGAVCAYGVAGLVATESGLDGIWAVVLGAVVAVIVAAGLVALLGMLGRQQGNSQISRESYQDLTAVVTLSIPPGGKGEVQFRDKNGVLVTKPAASTWSETMPAGTEATIKRVLADHVIVSRV